MVTITILISVIIEMSLQSSNCHLIVVGNENNTVSDNGRS